MKNHYLVPLFILTGIILLIRIPTTLIAEEVISVFKTSSITSNGWESKMDPGFVYTLKKAQDDDRISIIVKLKDQVDFNTIRGTNHAARLESLVTALREKAERTQEPLLLLLADWRDEGLVGKFSSFWIFNGLVVTASPEVIFALVENPLISRISPNETNFVLTRNDESSIEENITLIRAPELWDIGFRGEGIVVASMDTGVYLNHIDLVDKWRGGSNSWFDPYGEHPSTPTDLNGHGTHTMGIIVGGDGGGTDIGVAPEAQWVAVKIFDDAGQATAAAVHAGFQWLLDPDGDPGTDDAPHVINNSWTYQSPGCNLEFQLDLQALEAAGILPVFSAGNTAFPQSATAVGNRSSRLITSPAESLYTIYFPLLYIMENTIIPTSFSPANYPEAFAVGAIDNFSHRYPYSSTGPSYCGQESAIYPELVAPGVSIRTTERYGLYTQATGTSISAPHVSGALALLLSAFPGLSVAEQRSLLLDSAVDLGAVGPDNEFGYGRLDLYQAYHLGRNP